MTVRAKFKVNSIKREMGFMPGADKDEHGNAIYVYTEMWSIKMGPVHGNRDPNHENTKFWHATPSGSLTLGTVNKAAVEQFELNREFYIDITPAP